MWTILRTSFTIIQRTRVSRNGAVDKYPTLNWIRYGMVGFLLLAAVITIIANWMLRELHEFQVQAR